MDFSQSLGLRGQSWPGRIIVTELANNLWRHAGGGESLFPRATSRGSTDSTTPIRGIEILAMDKGPGMGILKDAWRMATPPRGAPGLVWAPSAGYPPIRKSIPRPKQGTVSLSQVWARPLPKVVFSNRGDRRGLRLRERGESSAGMPGLEKIIGDAGQEVLLVDGLGHGIAAASHGSGSSSWRFLSGTANLVEREAVNRAMHLALKPTVGAVAGLVEIGTRGSYAFLHR